MDSNSSSSPNPGSFFLVPERIRQDLKAPLGEFVPDSKVTHDLLLDHAFRFKTGESAESSKTHLGGLVAPTIVATVGDRTTDRVLELGLSPNLEIIDSRERRKDRKEEIFWSGSKERSLTAENQAGGIGSSALLSLEMCFSLLLSDPSQRVRLVIKGEEDLLTLPVVAFYPGRSIVLYGQPGEGLVIVDSLQARTRCTRYLIEMGIHSLRGS